MDLGLARRPAAVLIDVGFTLTAYDGASIAPLAASAGVTVGAAAIDATEPVVRREFPRLQWETDRGEGERARTLHGSERGRRFFRLILEAAAAAGGIAVLEAAAARLWDAHLERNLWRRVYDGVPEALVCLRAAGLRLAVVSNSEGTVEAMLADVGLRAHFEVVVDSWKVGVSKPDPRIFAVALERLGVAPADAVVIGDTPGADIDGARAAGVPSVLVDPYGHHPAVGVPRVDSFAAFARGLLATRS